MGESEEELKRILKELEERAKKLNDDKKDAARKAGIDARNHLDDLIRKLNEVEANISVLWSDADAFIDEFKDLEKSQDVEALKQAIQAVSDAHKGFCDERDGFDSELTALEEKEADIDTPTTTGDQWKELEGEYRSVDDKIVDCIARVDQLALNVESTEKDTENLQAKHAKKRSTYDECKAEQRKRQGDIGNMREHLQIMRKRLRDSRGALEDLLVSDDNGAAAVAKYKELTARFDDLNNQHKVLDTKVDVIQGMLDRIVVDLPLIGDKVLTQADLEDILQKLKELISEVERIQKEIDACDKLQKQLEDDADKFARKLRSDQLGDCEKSLNDAKNALEELKKKLQEMFGLLNPFTQELQDSKEGADDEKEVKIEELLSLAKEWDGEGRDVDSE